MRRYAGDATVDEDKETLWKCMQIERTVTARRAPELSYK